MFARALTELDRSQDIQTSKLECSSDNTWQHGNSLINYMKLVSNLAIDNIFKGKYKINVTHKNLNAFVS